ncbi:putative membrane protein YdbT with pleckstrin-like domain [Zhongshania antarctica]|uniref:Putative membrane protein YdbT with pleckstrin-like domain n=1 Tax=Zhongshania antarctica TaxID=641702 RepID=A0A840R0S4_9GAMM|nr:PH domain-containing protein [Zhongshania antarctica]MBB5186327.1 putative membrane protein YdbT with pleckstrin-like domain [Zhongshania antarctica]
MTSQYAEHPAMFRNKPLGFILAVILIPAAIGILILMVWYLRCKSTKLEINGNEVVLEQGLLSKERTELSVSGIRTVKINQSFFNRLFKVGTVSIYTAGDNPEIQAAGMPRPEVFRELVKAAQA